MTAIRYILSHLWPRVVFIILTGWMLYTVLDSMEAARFLAQGTREEVIKYYLMRAPSVAADLLGPAVVLGILSGVGTLNRHAELAAFAAAGRSLATTALPAVLAVALVASGGRVVLDEFVIPTTSRSVLRLAVDRFGIRGPRYHAFYQRTEWFRAGPILSLIHI